MVDGNGTTTYVYKAAGINGAGKLGSLDGPFSNDTISYTYDELGRVLTRMLNGTGTEINYDALGRLLQLEFPIVDLIRFGGHLPKDGTRSPQGQAHEVKPAELQAKSTNVPVTKAGDASSRLRRTDSAMIIADRGGMLYVGHFSCRDIVMEPKGEPWHGHFTVVVEARNIATATRTLKRFVTAFAARHDDLFEGVKDIYLDACVEIAQVPKSGVLTYRCKKARTSAASRPCFLAARAVVVSYEVGQPPDDEEQPTTFEPFVRLRSRRQRRVRKASKVLHWSPVRTTTH